DGVTLAQIHRRKTRSCQRPCPGLVADDWHRSVGDSGRAVRYASSRSRGSWISEYYTCTVVRGQRAGEHFAVSDGFCYGWRGTYVWNEADRTFGPRYDIRQ